MKSSARAAGEVVHFVLCQCLVAESNVAFHRVGKEENILRRRADAIA